MKHWLLKTSLFLFLMAVLHFGTLRPEYFQAFHALSPFLFAANLLTGAAASCGVLALVCGSVVLLLSLWKRRFFCRWLCPLGFLQDILRAVRKGVLKIVPKRFSCVFFRISFPAGMILALVSFGTLLVGGFTFLWLDPLVILSGAHSAHWCRLLLAGIGVSVLIFPHFWCFTLCPCGGTQELLWRLAHSLQKSKKGTVFSEPLQESKKGTVFSESLQESKKEAVFSENPSQPPARRLFFQSLGVFAAGAVLTAVLKRTMRVTLEKTRGAFLRFRPPGAVPEAEFLARCTRCGACVRVCPTRLLVPLEDIHDATAFQTPTLNFEPKSTEERVFCDENCTSCTQVCPTAALKPVKKEEKKSVRLAQCEFDYELCRRYYQRECSICIQTCPFGALEEVWSEATYSKIPSVNPSLCTGCGKCAAFCPGEPLVRWDADVYSEDIQGEESDETTGKKALKIVPLQKTENENKEGNENIE